VSRAQQLFDRQLQVDCVQRLQPFAERLNPRHAEIFRNFDAQYYWSAFQCEWASDILFRPGALQRLEPLLLRHGLLNFSSPDILRFLEQTAFRQRVGPGRIYRRDHRQFEESRHRGKAQILDTGNSLKCYGKAHTPVGDVFRVETMTANAPVFRAYRSVEGGPPEVLAWRPMP